MARNDTLFNENTIKMQRIYLFCMTIVLFIASFKYEMKPI